MSLVRTTLAASCLLFACGCDSNSPTKVGDHLEPVTQQSWTGTYQSATGSGDLVLDVTQSGTSLHGEIVSGLAPTTLHLYVSGTRDADSLHLALDPSHGPYTFTFALYGKMRADRGFDGGMRLSTGFEAEVHARELVRWLTVLENYFDVPYSVKSLAYDGAYLWLGTTGDADYVRVLPSNGTVVDSVHIFLRDDLHWTSSVLAWDGSKMWGNYPVAVGQPGGGVLEASDVMSFTAAGRAGDSLFVWHRMSGLAFDGANLVSLDYSGPTLRRFDRATGTIADSAHVGVPDATQLDALGSKFWTLGWYLHRLYELNADGSVALIADLRGDGDVTGLALQGDHVWIARAHVGYSTLYKVIVTPVPVP